MSTKYTYILFLFAVVLFGYVIWDNKERQITVNSIGKLKAIPISNADAVNKLILSTNGTKIVLARNNDKIWEITEPIQDRADSNIVTKMLETITTLKKFEIKEDDTQGKDMGIDDAAVSLEIFQNNEYTGKVTFGDETGLSGTVYANWSSDKVNDSFFCWADARNEIDISFDKLRDPQLVKSLIEEIQEIEVSDETGSSLRVIRKSEKSDWIIDKPLNTGTDSKRINEWLSNIVNLTSQNFIDNSESITASYFNSIYRSIKVKRFDNDEFIIIDFAKSDIQNESYVRVTDRPGIIFKTGSEAIKSIDLNPNTIRDKRLIPFNPKSVIAMNIEAKPDYKVNLLQDNNGWQIVENSSKTKADRQRIYKILESLSSEKVEEFVADAAGNLEPWGLNQPTLKVSLKLIGIDPKKPKKDDGSPNLIDISKELLVKGQLSENQDVVQYFATIKGSGSVARLSPAFPSIIPIRPLDYKELYLWPPFNISSVKKIITTNPPQIPLELNYEFETNQWTASIAEENVSQKIDQTQALTLAQQLSLPVRATQWLSKNTGDAEIELLKPIRRVEFILIDSNNTEIKYKIEIAPVNRDGNNLLYYARINDSKEICFIDKENFDVLNSQIIKDTGE
ncbi:MAG: DUF4340 domain-containing protein [Verrucomicrobiota bacterium]|nr:DUF4340 domain-containing protein [Verrucomicrobiota bacterium]